MAAVRVKEYVINHYSGTAMESWFCPGHTGTPAITECLHEYCETCHIALHNGKVNKQIRAISRQIGIISLMCNDA